MGWGIGKCGVGMGGSNEGCFCCIFVGIRERGGDGCEGYR